MSNKTAYTFLAILGSASILAGVVAWAGRVTPADIEHIRAARQLDPEAVRAVLTAHPEILVESLQALRDKNEDAVRIASVQAVAAAWGDLVRPTDIMLGHQDASKVVVEFFDYQCGYCRGAYAAVSKLLDGDRNLAVVIRPYPILGTASVQAAKAVVAAREQGRAVEMHTALLRQQLPLSDDKIFQAAKSSGLDLERLRRDMELNATKAEVEASLKVGKTLGVTGTPTFAARGAGMLTGFDGEAQFRAFLHDAAR